MKYINLLLNKFQISEWKKHCKTFSIKLKHEPSFQIVGSWALNVYKINSMVKGGLFTPWWTILEVMDNVTFWQLTLNDTLLLPHICLLVHDPPLPGLITCSISRLLITTREKRKANELRLVLHRNGKNDMGSGWAKPLMNLNTQIRSPYSHLLWRDYRLHAR